MAITLPVVLLIIDYYPLARDKNGWTGLFIEKIPFFALSAASAILTLRAQSSGGAVTSMASYTLPVRLMVAIRGYVFYLYKLIFPATLAPYYPLPLNPGLGDPFFLASLAFLILTTIFCLILAIKGKRALPALWLYYLVTLVPVIGIVQVGSQAAADRYAYLPTVGSFILAGAILGLVYKRPGTSKKIALIITIAAISLLTFKTIKTIPVWKNSISLWSHEIDFLQANAKHDRLASIIARYNRAKAFEIDGQLARAVDDYSVVLTLNPAYLDAYINRGVIYGKTGRFDKALSDLNRAVAIDPASWAARYNRGLVYKNLGETEKAMRDFEAAQALRRRRH